MNDHEFRIKFKKILQTSEDLFPYHNELVFLNGFYILNIVLMLKLICFRSLHLKSL
jgi:hypothetical protein